MSEIQALTVRTQELSNAVDFWNAVMLGGLAIAALAALWIGISTRLVVVRSGQLTDAQNLLTAAKDRQLRSDLKEKDGQIAKVQVDASNALAAQQKVEIELDKQRVRTANAEKAASDAALALAKFKEPRSLSPAQQAKFVTGARPFAGQNFALAVFPDPEPQALARKIDELLKSSGWNRVPSQI